MAELYRPEGIEHDDNLGFGTLCYTLNAAASPYPASPAPSVPTGLKVTASVGKLWLRWFPVASATGYNVLRSTTSGGPYTTIATYTGTSPLYEDAGVTNGCVKPGLADVHPLVDQWFFKPVICIRAHLPGFACKEQVIPSLRINPSMEEHGLLWVQLLRRQWPAPIMQD